MMSCLRSYRTLSEFLAQLISLVQKQHSTNTTNTTQITSNLFLFFVIFGDVTSQMSQTYLPPFFREREFVKNQVVSGSSASLNADVARSKSNKSNKASQLFDAQSDKDAAKHIIYRVMRIGAVAGVANFLCCLLLPRSQYKVRVKLHCSAVTVIHAFVLCSRIHRRIGELHP